MILFEIQKPFDSNDSTDSVIFSLDVSFMLERFEVLKHSFMIVLNPGGNVVAVLSTPFCNLMFERFLSDTL